MTTFGSDGGTNFSQSDTLQVKSPILVKQISGATRPFIFYEPGTGAGCNMYIVCSTPISSKRLLSSGSQNKKIVKSIKNEKENIIIQKFWKDYNVYMKFL